MNTSYISHTVVYMQVGVLKYNVLNKKFDGNLYPKDTKYTYNLKERKTHSAVFSCSPFVWGGILFILFMSIQ